MAWRGGSSKADQQQAMDKHIAEWEEKTKIHQAVYLFNKEERDMHRRYSMSTAPTLDEPCGEAWFQEICAVILEKSAAAAGKGGGYAFHEPDIECECFRLMKGKGKGSDQILEIRPHVVRCVLRKSGKAYGSGKIWR